MMQHFVPFSRSCAGLALLAVGFSAALGRSTISNREKPFLTLKGHQSELAATCFSSDGRLLATADFRHIIILWDARTGARLRSFHHADYLFAATFTPDGKALATGFRHGKVVFISTEDGHTLWEINTGLICANVLSFSADGRLLAVVGGNGVQVIDLSTDKIIQEFPQNQNPGGFSPDGGLLASAVPYPSQDTIIRETVGWTEVTRIPGREKKDSPDMPTSVGFSPDGAQVAVGTFQGDVAIWTTKGKMIWRSRSQHPMTTQMSFAANGSLLVSGGGETFKVWDATNGRRLWGGSVTLGVLRSMAVSPDSRTIALGTSEGTVELWHMHR
ncbi:MAG: WD40 repeat domain-containing protein [Armatimonadota bacterium]|nr:WD40 repeat domain-containing protein [Armatimonadota bacterium]